MAYNQKNLLEKIVEIQAIALKYNKQGLFYKEIYHRYIEQQYHISKRTFDSYLGINAKKKLKEINNKIEPIMKNLEIIPMIEHPTARVFLSHIEMQNGTNSKMMTIFDNSAVGFEEVFIGIKESLRFISETKSVSSELYSVKNGILDYCGIMFSRTPINHYQPQV